MASFSSGQKKKVLLARSLCEKSPPLRLGRAPQLHRHLHPDADRKADRRLGPLHAVRGARRRLPPGGGHRDGPPVTPPLTALGRTHTPSGRDFFCGRCAFLLHSGAKYDKIRKAYSFAVMLAMSDSACCAVRHTDAGPVRLGRCEPGQVGNQAALSGVHGAFQPACIRMPSFARRGTTPRRCLFVCMPPGRRPGRDFLPEGGSGHVSCPLPQVAAPAVRRCGGPAGHRGGPEKPGGRRPGGATPICSPGCGAPARPPAPRSLPRRSTAWTPKTATPCGQCAVCRGIDDGSILDVVEMDAASNNGVDDIRDLRDETAYNPQHLPAIRCTSSTRCTCSPPRPSTPCSKRWKSPLPTSSLSWPPPRSRRCRPPSAPAASGTTSPASARRTSPGGWPRWPGPRAWPSPRGRRG